MFFDSVFENCYRFETLGSTNDEAVLLAKNNCNNFSCVIADRQTKGRGRNGNIWDCCGENLYMSLVIREFASLNKMPFIVAVALGEAINSVVCENVSYKWPNDIFIQGKKVAGILIESKILGENPEWSVIGIGVNISSCPIGATYINDFTKSFVSRDDFFGILLPKLMFFLDNQKIGFDEVKSLWLSSACNLGKSTVINNSSGSVVHDFLGLDENGYSLFKPQLQESRNFIQSRKRDVIKFSSYDVFR